MSLEIESELRALLATSSDCVWRRDKTGYGECWSNDGEWHILGTVARGRAAIEGMWWDLMQPFVNVWQLSHNIVFAFDREQPAGRVYLEETLRLPNDQVNLLKGVYHDSYTYEDGRWRFAKRHIDIAYLGGSDMSGRWFPMVDHGPAPHDRDPSRVSTPSMAEAYG